MCICTCTCVYMYVHKHDTTPRAARKRETRRLAVAGSASGESDCLGAVLLSFQQPMFQQLANRAMIFQPNGLNNY